MNRYVTAAQLAAVIALFALPPLLAPHDADAAERRYGTHRPSRAPSNPQPVYTPPVQPKSPSTNPRDLCRGYKALGRPLEYKECLDRHR